MATNILSASCRQSLLGRTARLGQQTRQLQLVPGTAYRRMASEATPAFRASKSASSSARNRHFYAMAAAFPLAIFSLDSRPAGLSLVPEASQEAQRPSPGYHLPLNAQLATQISKGSLSGFLAGLLVSIFSRSLVLLLGVAISLQSVAAKLGVDLVHTLKLKERANSSKILTALSRNTAFKLSFGIAFTLAAFAHF
ncbi:hypothetical protein CMQ_7496 [Grosmannia clavigera kw1407]|uniref:Fun14 family protein n=1 Tax=Grosmannia clavigera (strain kw1407 / UAMH 11150) TaxID=655863 RepID=F0XQ10_GROCL|nr:uncharacterized protein CMQ_7496 [Grosmannia clavigera kw1407]EFX00494.1 hypothetical protein CMQ_7496 [Grosmannia clavigera kw1407]